ncbi:MAG TPA: bifunctional shikimate kinase/3-dehydroquinate synthase [Gaiellaceae bacterium]|nr:bifunctional shikimate kinase/3-dehydroquinate synthase [Gaiellaceae bacterium]
MGAGKSTLGPELAARLGRSFVSIDALVEARTGATVQDLFGERGEPVFRELEEQAAVEALAQSVSTVVELGGGALASERTRPVLAARAFTLLLETSPEEAWERVSNSDRPLARDPESFGALYAERRDLYESVADGRARDLDGAVLVAAGVHVGRGSLDGLGRLVPGSGPVELVAAEAVDGLHGARARDALGDRVMASHVVPSGEAAKTLAEAERLWSTLRLDRDGTIVVLGGGSTTDLTGFVAATYLRGVAWAPIPTTLVGQVDAAIGGKTAVDLDGKNRIGAFHWPARVVVDPDLLSTLPPAELENGRAEVVKTGLLAGEPLWELPRDEQVRRCAAFKAAICLRDPLDRGARAWLNLGHTFAHALEAASGYTLPHGRAVALGLLAAVRLSGLDDLARDMEIVLGARPVRVDRDAAWVALQQDKKRAEGRVRIVVLDAPGSPRIDDEVSDDALRRALDTLIE